MGIPEEEKWDILGIEEFFKNATFPEGIIKLSSGMTIFNLERFINTHLSICKANNGNKTYLPYFNRLLALKEIISD